MRICVITGTFHPEIGGPPVYLYNLCHALSRKGHDLLVLTYGDVEKEISYPFKVRRISRKQPVIIRLLLFVFCILRFGGKYDVWYVNDYGLPAVLANFFLRKPVVMKVVSDFAWEYSLRHRLIPPDMTLLDFQKSRTSLKAGLLKFLRTFYIKHARLVIAPGRCIRDLCESWGVRKERIRKVYNGVDLRRYSPGSGPARARKKLNLPLKAKIIITVTRLIEGKGLRELIRLVPVLPAGYTLVLAGEGPVRPDLEQLIREEKMKKRIILTGALAHDRVADYLRSSDLFVLYSAHEGLPHVVLEAMACGVPVVVSDRGGNTELVTNRMNGLVVRYGDTDDLKGAIRTVFSDPGLRKRMVRNSLQKVKKFDFTALADKMERILKSYAGR